MYHIRQEELWRLRSLQSFYGVEIDLETSIRGFLQLALETPSSSLKLLETQLLHQQHQKNRTS